MGMSEADRMLRRYSIGASEWSQVLGISPFGDASRVYQSKTGEETHNWVSKHVQDGNDAEDFVLALAEKRLPLVAGSSLVGKQVKLASQTHPYLTATLDGLAEVIVADQQVTAVIEAKTISTAMYSVVPEYYLTQVLAQMYVAGVGFGFLVVWSKKDQEFKSFLIRRADHEAYLQSALARVLSFWTDHVQAGIPPEKKVVEREDNVQLPEELLEAFLNAQDAEKVAKEAKESARDRLLECLGEKEEYRAKDHRYQIDLTTNTTKRLDTKAMQAKHPDVAEKFYTESKSQRLVIKRVGIKSF